MSALENTYFRDFADIENAYTAWEGAKAPSPSVLKFNGALATELGLDPAQWDADVLTGTRAPEGATPLAQVYAGHQFGGFSAQLGDGRALLLGEVLGPDGVRRDIALKGSGRTPYSRGGDGKAVVGPVLREYLIGEAMHALGIPTTRALGAALTGEQVLREAGPLPGAVLARVAASHLRVGTFQYFAARQDHDGLARLLAYAIARHAPQAARADVPALAFLTAVRDAQAQLVAKWMSVGFVHGVMNTDNMTISGETIDYGPCAFMDSYDELALFSSIDQTGRYAFSNQPIIAQWNLARLAEALLLLIDEDQDAAIKAAVPVIEGFWGVFDAAWADLARAKLGLVEADDGDAALMKDLLTAMQGQDVDFTRAFRFLAADLRGASLTRGLFKDATAFDAWVPRWKERTDADSAARMDAVNPVYIPRNHLVEEALSAAEHGDMQPFEALLAVLEHPFTADPSLDRYGLPAPAGFGRYTTFCGT